MSDFITAIIGKDFERARGLSCNARSPIVMADFDPATWLGGRRAGTVERSILDAMTVTVADLVITGEPDTELGIAPTSRVKLGGRMNISVPDDKLREYTRASLANDGGGSPTDEQVESQIVAVKTRLAAGMAFRSEVDMQIDGMVMTRDQKSHPDWAVCGPLIAN
jgi:hypothetical protein